MGWTLSIAMESVHPISENYYIFQTKCSYVQTMETNIFFLYVFGQSILVTDASKKFVSNKKFSEPRLMLINLGYVEVCVGYKLLKW